LYKLIIIFPFQIDKDSDGKLTFEEVKAISKKAYSRKSVPPAPPAKSSSSSRRK